MDFRDADHKGIEDGLKKVFAESAHLPDRLKVLLDKLAESERAPPPPSPGE